jgi:hypothetical protein
MTASRISSSVMPTSVLRSGADVVVVVSGARVVGGGGGCVVGGGFVVADVLGGMISVVPGVIVPWVTGGATVVTVVDGVEIGGNVVVAG